MELDQRHSIQQHIVTWILKITRISDGNIIVPNDDFEARHNPESIYPPAICHALRTIRDFEFLDAKKRTRLMLAMLTVERPFNTASTRK